VLALQEVNLLTVVTVVTPLLAIQVQLMQMQVAEEVPVVVTVVNMPVLVVL
jgi:hypothetical protein